MHVTLAVVQLFPLRLLSHPKLYVPKFFFISLPFTLEQKKTTATLLLFLSFSALHIFRHRITIGTHSMSTTFNFEGQDSVVFTKTSIHTKTGKTTAKLLH